MCMFPPLPQHHNNGPPTVPVPRTRISIGCCSGEGQLRIDRRDPGSHSQRTRPRDQRAPRTRGGACGCACRASCGAKDGARSSAMRPPSQRRGRSGQPWSRTRGRAPPTSSCRRKWRAGGTGRSERRAVRARVRIGLRADTTRAGRTCGSSTEKCVLRTYLVQSHCCWAVGILA